MGLDVVDDQGRGGEDRPIPGLDVDLCVAQCRTGRVDGDARRPGVLLAITQFAFVKTTKQSPRGGAPAPLGGREDAGGMVPWRTRTPARANRR